MRRHLVDKIWIGLILGLVIVAGFGFEFRPHLTTKKRFLRFESVWSISTQRDFLRFPSPLDSHLAVNALPQPPLVQSYPVNRDFLTSHVVDSRNRLWIHFRQDSQIFFEIRELCKNFVVEINLETAKKQLKTGLNRNKLVQSE